MTENPNNIFSIKDQFNLIVKNWYWFLISLIVCLTIAFLIKRYSIDIYQATAAVMIKDTKSGGLSETGVLGDLNILGNSYNTVENEIEVLKSRRLMRKVVKELDIYISYTAQGKVIESPVYKGAAVEVDVLNEEVLEQDFPKHQFKLSAIDKNSFRLTDLKGRSSDYSYGSVFEYGDLSLIVTYDDLAAEDLNDFTSLNITISSIESATLKYGSRLIVSKIDRRSSVLSLSQVDPVPQRAEDVINELIKAYNDDAIKDKNAVARKTAEFIQDRMDEVRTDLDSIERRLEGFKSDRNLTDIAAESLINLEETTGLTGQVMNIESQLNIAENIARTLNDPGYNLLPESFGFEDPSLQQQAIRFNQLLTRYRDLSKTASERNPSLIALKSELDQLVASLRLSINQVIQSLESRSQNIQRELNRTIGEIRETPENERLSRALLRNREVVETIYLLLSEKRETTAISLVVTTPKAKVVDFALTDPTPISPKPVIILLISLIISFLLPFGILYARNLIYNKIESREDVEYIHPNITVLGEIPKFENSTRQTIVNNDRSILAESFRILRTNLQFKLSALSTYKRAAPVILVTSSVKGEGKTFVSFNLAVTLALTNKKVLLIGGDIRNPQIHRYLNNESRNSKGLTELLTTSDLTTKDVTVTYPEVANLDIILSGAIPPNPAELLMSDEMDVILDSAAQEYDYIILDSAPTILVTDTLLISKYADVTAYVARANYTDKPLLSFIKENVERGKLENLTMIINDVKQSNFGYGSKYTYHYAAAPQGLWQRLKQKFSRQA